MESRDRLKNRELRITPQRLAILEAVEKLNNHPTAENILDFIRKKNPGIAAGTVYKVLETFVEKGLIKKVTTERDIMRYDAVLEPHHHLYCPDSDRIEDYYDDELSKLIEDFLKRKQIPDFQLREFRIQIIGKFLRSKSSKP